MRFRDLSTFRGFFPRKTHLFQPLMLCPQPRSLGKGFVEKERERRDKPPPAATADMKMCCFQILPVYAYRDSRTEAVIPKVHKILPFSELYAKTGCQFQPFNSIYQLYADKLAGRLEGVTDFLMIPEYLLWKLCGVKAKEYTNATTTGMVSAAAITAAVTLKKKKEF